MFFPSCLVLQHALVTGGGSGIGRAGGGLEQKPPLYLNSGDVVEISIDGLGTHRPIARTSPPPTS